MSAYAIESLRSLLTAPSRDRQEAAWGAFLEEHSRLILSTARRAASSQDDVMDRYAYVLDRLREGDFRRLRAFAANGSGKFTTWLVVVVRRLCVDHHRSVYGRTSQSAEDPDALARRRLAGLVAADVDPDEIPVSAARGPDAELIRSERVAMLERVLEGLESRDRLLLTLRYVDDRSPVKIARMLGYSSRFAVRRRLKTLLSTVRDELEERGFDR